MANSTSAALSEPEFLAARRVRAAELRDAIRLQMAKKREKSAELRARRQE